MRIGGGLAIWRTLDARMRDPAFLQKQLDLVSSEGGAEPAPPPPQTLVRVGAAEWKEIQPSRSIIGRLVEVRKVTVASEVSGKILDLPVEEGTPVVGGQTLLARIDDVWCRLALERSEAQIDSVNAKLGFQQLELNRQQDLVRKDAISQSEIDSTEAVIEELEATLKEAAAAAHEQRERCGRAEILAPFDGAVIAKHAEIGGLVSPGTPLVDIVSRDEIDASLMVPESMINLIRIGQDLAVEIDVLEEEVEGKVVLLTPYGPTASRTFPVRVRLDDQQGRLKVGMSVTALVASGPRRESLVVPRDAVLTRPDGSTVWVASGTGAAEFAEVQPVPVAVTARMRDEQALEPETDEGRRLLVAGAAVVIEGAERLTPGQQVRIVALEGRAAQSRESADASRSARGTVPFSPTSPRKSGQSPAAAGSE